MDFKYTSGGPISVYHLVQSLRCVTTGAIILLATTFNTPISLASESIRKQEITECKINEVATWEDGKDRPAVSKKLFFTYAHQDSPPWFKDGQIINLLSRSATAWSQCGIDIQIIPWNNQIQPGNNLILIKWDEKESGGNFALSNLSRRTIAMSPKAFDLLRRRNPGYDANITLQMLLSHEMGHFLGLMAHSRRCIDVMSYYTNTAGERCFSRNTPHFIRSLPEYRHMLPTACDIERCRKANGIQPSPGNKSSGNLL